MQERMSEKSRTQCGKPVSENSRMQLEFRAGAVVMMAWQHYLYDGSGQLMAIRYKGADYYYIRDGLMTITGLIDANGFKASEKTIYSWENGNSQPTPDALLVMCRAYGVEDVLGTFGYAPEKPTTIAAHFDGNEFTPEQIEKIKAFAAFIKFDDQRK